MPSPSGFTRSWPNGNSCRANTSPTPALSTQSCSSAASKTYGIDLIGPTRGDNHWQAKAGAGFAARDFAIDWEQQTATCPAGQDQSRVGRRRSIKFKNHVIKIKFGKTDCRDVPVVRSNAHAPAHRAAPSRSGPKRSTRHCWPGDSASRRRRSAPSMPGEQAWKARSRKGCVPTGCVARAISGLPKTHLQHLMTAAAMNVVRMLRWFAGEPKATTPVSAFARLYQPVT